MARNGSGTYSLPAGNPVVTGTTIQSTWANNTLSDIATALTQSLSQDGQTPVTANLPMGGFKLTGLAAGTTAGDSVRYEQFASPPAIGGTAAAAGSFTTLSASSTVSGTGFSTYLASPPAIGGTAPAAANFTTIGATGQITSTLATGTAPFVVASTTPVANLSIGGNAATATNISGTVAIANGGTGQTTAAAAVAALAPIQLQTVKATTSGSSVSQTGIPANVKRVTINFNGVSTNGVNFPIIQLGTSLGLETTSYISACQQGTAVQVSTSGFVLYNSTAANALYGSITLNLESASNNTWNASGVLYAGTSVNLVGIAAGVKSLAGALTQLALVTADTFDAGEFSVSWEF